MALIESDYGMEGFSVVIKLLMKIYDEGYFYHWGEKELKLFARRVNLKNDLIEEIVQAALRWDFFDQKLFDTFGILTSRGIQRRYFGATYRRKDVPIAKEYILLDALEVEKHKHLVVFSLYPEEEEALKTDTSTTERDVNIQPAADPLMSTFTLQSKGKQNKEKKKKVKERKASAEKRTEIKKDTDDEVDLFEIYEHYFKTPSSYIKKELLNWHAVFELPIIQNALEKAVQNGKTFAYANSILKSYQQNNIQTLEDIEAYDAAFKNRFKPKKQSDSQSKETLPSWFNKAYEEQPSETAASSSVQNRLKKLSQLKKVI